MIHWDPANPEAALYHHRASVARAAAWREGVARLVSAALRGSGTIARQHRRRASLAPRHGGCQPVAGRLQETG